MNLTVPRNWLFTSPSVQTSCRPPWRRNRHPRSRNAFSKSTRFIGSSVHAYVCTRKLSGNMFLCPTPCSPAGMKRQRNSGQEQQLVGKAISPSGFPGTRTRTQRSRFSGRAVLILDSPSGSCSPVAYGRTQLIAFRRRPTEWGYGGTGRRRRGVRSLLLAE